jgi:hypothetical protein
MVGSSYTDSGIQIILNRTYGDASNSTPDVVKVGQDQTDPTSSDTDLTEAVPITNGTVNDNGDNQLTGSSGGDNTTDNTTTFKPGAGLSDDTSQNLIANDTNVLKIWTIADLSSLGTNITITQPFGLWFFILDQTTLDKFLSSGTALEIKLGSDSSNYFSYTREASDLSIGWNWITSGTINVEDLTETGTVGTVDTFIIEVTTNNATDEFTTGDVLYDLLRQWAISDLIKSEDSGYPIIDLTALTIAHRATISSVEANGFNLSGFGTFNQDTTPKIEGLDAFDEESKSDSDQFIYTAKNKHIVNNAI